MVWYRLLFFYIYVFTSSFRPRCTLICVVTASSRIAARCCVEPAESPTHVREPTAGLRESQGTLPEVRVRQTRQAQERGGGSHA